MFCLMDLQVFTSYTHQREAELNQNTLLQSEIREKFLDPQISDSLEVFSGEKKLWMHSKYRLSIIWFSE